MRKKISLLLWKSGLYEYVVPVLHRIERFTQPRKIRTYLATHQIRKLHIGAGPNLMDEWLNVDIDPGGYPLDKPHVTYLDARGPFPFPDASFDYIFTEHMIEHITYEEGRRMIQEAFRVLRPNGVLRISTPSLRRLLELYEDEKTDCQIRYLKWSADRYFTDKSGRLETRVINNFFYSWGHRFIYDYQTLSHLLRDAGFTDLTRCAVGESQHDELMNIEYHGSEITDEFNKYESLIVEATRPHHAEDGLRPVHARNSSRSQSDAPAEAPVQPSKTNASY